MTQSKAEVATTFAKRYLGQLCKHFGHKIPVELALDEGRGSIAFPFGTCRLAAEGGTLHLTAEAEGPDAIAQVQDVIARHLIRFAFREELAVSWALSPAP
ncbi:DUF2218 domain-containing protein [Zavarzinia aquatilis]|uniref:DUF2218 domain-containing protein n=1 Tax=Zavarzinia aquatilis TaxID=2211142 RepID=A0A317E2L4_9PROT|nr:DUF2218 domain-containing protein [Zavarzinia aquatilis]PWR21239.1 DUF2218 domain-containing protein [Zavarzinia aquatilis]